jgi:hypothetical protein
MLYLTLFENKRPRQLSIVRPDGWIATPVQPAMASSFLSIDPSGARTGRAEGGRGEVKRCQEPFCKPRVKRCQE